jgi:hypothetical protein
VPLIPTIANALWNATNAPACRRFRRALREPRAAQEILLREMVLRHAGTAFGEAHDFGTIRNYDEFARRVPLADYEVFEPWMARIRRGEKNVLTCDPVTHLVPTSGTAGARKLIPFTAGLQHQFNAAIAPWMTDLQGQRPGISGGPAYWSITPALRSIEREISSVPIGFDDDTAYLGGVRKIFADSVMAAPAELRLIESVEHFRYATLLCLLRQRELRLISVWHPSFLSLLLDALPVCREELINDVRRGTCRKADELTVAVRAALKQSPQPARARELERADPRRPETLWPRLRLISCWGDGAAGLALAGLKKLFPNTVVQPKGLLATEAFVTIPFDGKYPLAVCSHFFEFIDDTGAVRLVDELREGRTYEVVVTTAGGLWRYCLGDRVEVTGFAGRTPSLRFMGRRGNVSDLCGEKLSEAFVAQAIGKTLAVLGLAPRFVLLAPERDGERCGYTLFLEGTTRVGLAETLDEMLRENPHYAWCRDLGQLRPVRVFVISADGCEAFLRRQAESGARLGDVKPAALSRLPGWSKIFSGCYTSEIESADFADLRR